MSTFSRASASLTDSSLNALHKHEECEGSSGASRCVRVCVSVSKSVQRHQKCARRSRSMVEHTAGAHSGNPKNSTKRVAYHFWPLRSGHRSQTSRGWRRWKKRGFSFHKAPTLKAQHRRDAHARTSSSSGARQSRCTLERDSAALHFCSTHART